MYFKENWQSMAEKEPAFGHVTMFQTSPSRKEALPADERGSAGVSRPPRAGRGFPPVLVN